MCTAWRYSSAHFIYAISLYAVKGAKEETSNSIRHTRTEHAEFKQLPLVMHITWATGQSLEMGSDIECDDYPMEHTTEANA
jgi:tryptophan synthase alpha subunit